MQLLRSVDLSYLKRLEQQPPGKPTRAVQQQVVASSADICSGRILVWEQRAPAQELYLPPNDSYSVFFSMGPEQYSVPTVQWREGVMDVRTPNVGDLTIAPPYRAMYFRSFVPYRLLHVSVSQDMLAQVVGTGDQGAQTRLRNCFGETDPIITALGGTLLAYIKAPGPKAKEFLESVGTSMAVRLLERFAEKTLPVKGKLSQAQLKLIDDYLEGHQDGRVTLESVAALLGMSTYYFHKLFKATLGMPPMRYALGLRMRRARALVEGTRKPLGDIAAEIGCPDQSHFTKMFRKHWGVLPSQLRGQ
ncbi:MAG TPA: helix-turn-helix transcriptional regulator [Ramlibacter sp.]|nr:helix-turn-helix transcriptional regulator [Ramlibacter sp.]